MGAAQRVQPHLGQAPVQDLAFGHQVLHRTGDILDRHLRVDAVLVEEIDAVGAQALQHALDGQLDTVRAADEPRAPLAGLEIDVPAELRGDHHLVAERLHAFAEDPFHLVGAVGLGRVVEGDATVEGRPDDVDHLGPGRDRRLIGAAHVLDAEADAGDLQRAKLPPPACPGRDTAGIADCLG